MNLRKLAFLFFVLLAQCVDAQDNLVMSAIPAELEENANAVVRYSRIDIKIDSRKSMNIKKTRTVTVLNESGLEAMDASEYFEKSTTIKAIEAVIYNNQGKEIKKIKRKDFKETSLSQGSIITDNKLLYLDYTPIQYPFTIVYSSETQTSNTAFIPRWTPIEQLLVSTQKAIISITYNDGLGFKYKDYNFSEGMLKKEQLGNNLTLTCENMPARKDEEYSPSFLKIMPHVLFAIEKFHLEGLDGEAGNWSIFGSWIYNNLLKDTEELSPETVAYIKAATANETDPLKKAAIVYKYVQSKTRYISIQLGIGGWKPMLAKDVDRLGYGDCKALTNYTRSLLKAAGVEAYYTVVYGDTEKRDIKPDFISMQGNHVILAIPDKDKYTWLECTSQTAPFGFQGDFTDDRLALVVKPTGGEVVKTHVYSVTENTQVSTGAYSITENGAIAGTVLITSKGIQYDNKYYLENKSKDDLDKIYKSGFSNINNLKLKKTGLINKKETQEFVEDIALEAEGYCTKSGNRIMFAVNAFNLASGVPQRYRARQNAFEIDRGFYDTDEVVISLPESFAIEAKPENITITDKFGEYKSEYEIINDKQMRYKRTLLVNAGYYDSKEYENYRLFREKVSRNDNAKMVLVKK
jgi:transglutaminase-like putative cysteine protease